MHTQPEQTGRTIRRASRVLAAAAALAVLLTACAPEGVLAVNVLTDPGADLYIVPEEDYAKVAGLNPVDNPEAFEDYKQLQRREPNPVYRLRNTDGLTLGRKTIIVINEGATTPVSREITVVRANRALSVDMKPAAAAAATASETTTQPTPSREGP